MPFVQPAFALAAALLLSGSMSPQTTTDPAEEPLQSVYLNVMYHGDLDAEQPQARLDEETEESQVLHDVEIDDRYDDGNDERQTDVDEWRETLVSPCVDEDGFPSTPGTQNSTFTSSEGDEWEPEDREWGAQYAYGTGSYFDDQEFLPTTEYVDRNAEDVASLPESEQRAYGEALHGATSDASEPVDDLTFDHDVKIALCGGDED